MNNKKQIKQLLLTAIRANLNQRKAAINQRLGDIMAGLQNETKSTAGDKHETGRAMLQIERENLGRQLAVVEQQELTIQRIAATKKLERAALGALIKTASGNYFLSISKGELKIENETYYAIGLGSPIGKLLLGKQKGDQFEFGGKIIIVDDII